MTTGARTAAKQESNSCKAQRRSDEVLVGHMSSEVPGIFLSANCCSGEPACTKGVRAFGQPKLKLTLS